MGITLDKLALDTNDTRTIGLVYTIIFKISLL